MKFVPDNLGAEPKKIAILGGLVVVLGAVYFLNRTPGNAPPLTVTSPGNTAAAKAANPLTPAPAVAALTRNEPALPLPPARTTARRGENVVQDFRPTLKLPVGTDVSTINPELNLEAMAKVREVGIDGVRRSLFEFGAAAAPAIPKVAPVKPAPVAPPPAPAPVVPPAPVAPAKAVAPPIPLKFYGFVNDSAAPPRRGFFLDGEDIVVAGENETIRNRYHILRINANTAVVEDNITKSQQTLTLVEEVQG